MPSTIITATKFMTLKKSGIIIALLLILNMMLIVTATCEIIVPIQIENKTSEILTVYIYDMRIGDVTPNYKIKNNMAFAGWDWYLIEAYNSHRDVVYSANLTDEELKELDWKVIISKTG